MGATHDWSGDVDEQHLAQIRGEAGAFAAGGPLQPVMATRDLRFFGRDDAPLLPDGRPRSGISVVAALSTWLVHTNRRREGGWSRRFEHGIPSGPLDPLPASPASGTVVHFLPDLALVAGSMSADEVRAAARTYAGVVPVEVVAEGVA
ncbi:hypothetical protein [Terrabacter sp. NPDC000476]|uniref:hypothetical protein n=1 Tax=Terrabacter sp. NPDC000476 TaxID=3154258 RepID=UPI003333B8E8